MTPRCPLCASRARPEPRRGSRALVCPGCHEARPDSEVTTPTLRESRIVAHVGALPVLLPCAGPCPSSYSPAVRAAMAEYPARLAAAVNWWRRLEAAGYIRTVPEVPCPPAVDDDGEPPVHPEAT